MGYITNPILKGFNPDPSIIRVGDNYYIATSTFEWFPGVQIHHSRDLINWRLISRPLKRLSQLNMLGDPCSGGIFAPCLSYDNGTFYLVYTDVKTGGGVFNDNHNYLVTTTDIEGEWSEPVYLNSAGFDPSLFHDDDGSKWLTYAAIDYRSNKTLLTIDLQQYSPEKKCLVGPVKKIFSKYTEGPHLYKKNGYYYLMTAHGGTWYNHTELMARSKSIYGPYEEDPTNPIITSRDDVTLELQKAGHADLVETQNGEWYMVHLCGRPIPTTNRCTLGRETAIQKVVWTEDGWLRLENGGNKPSLNVLAADLPEHLWVNKPARDDFDSEELDINFQSLRVPMEESWISLKERSGYLRLKGRNSLSSTHYQSLVARRQQSFCYTAATCVEFEPYSFRHMAGLVCYYNTNKYYYLYITHDEVKGKCLSIVGCDDGRAVWPMKECITIEEGQRVYLRVKVDYNRLQFYYSKDEKSWIKVGPVLDASKLSDDYGYGFTGAFVGLCCQDGLYQNIYADFDFFEYIERDMESN
jgi:xylan 1,4-beta-xylosidase